ncbi:MAG: GNAT family N-acetyltransferase [Ignavibacteria bacterium]|nr:GNAT family N-acetyltransferase [Ignavibacteria bacterium]
MNIQLLNPADLKEAAKFCRINMKYDIMPDFLFKEKAFDDPDFDPELALVVKEGEEIIAFMMGVIRNHKKIGKIGYIKLMAVKPSERRKGIATKLYKILEDKFIKEGCEKVRIYESHPNYFQPGIDPLYTEAICFAERLGFKKFNDTANMICNLVGQNFDTSNDEQRLLNDGIIIKRAEKNDYENTMKFILENFELWENEVNMAFKNNPISIHIAIYQDRVVGFSAYDTNNLNTGWFGPMGTSPEMRGKNIGGVLLKRCLKDQQAQGHQFAIIPWVGPIPFYSHYCGAKVQRVFWRYEKLLK